MKAKIYHSARCSKPRATLALFTERGMDIEMSDDELVALLQ
jgi:arsenate reductase-like glutaredoxin family protein